MSPPRPVAPPPVRCRAPSPAFGQAPFLLISLSWRPVSAAPRPPLGTRRVAGSGAACPETGAPGPQWLPSHCPDRREGGWGVEGPSQGLSPLTESPPPQQHTHRALDPRGQGRRARSTRGRPPRPPRVSQAPCGHRPVLAAAPQRVAMIGSFNVGRPPSPVAAPAVVKCHPGSALRILSASPRQSARLGVLLGRHFGSSPDSFAFDVFCFFEWCVQV
ncbi:hypothetical protein NDU88_009338 [Pleurodeles waltl]|uniref:Uncharacterized protein n=1 Tax=Pleurodeles waltl TaxID=8319 RepID=A0AAV7QRA6_PLEWA|nr:hypothetical protein NDU88_009338 [Pleurodeles waltl]